MTLSPLEVLKQEAREEFGKINERDYAAQDAFLDTLIEKAVAAVEKECVPEGRSNHVLEVFKEMRIADIEQNGKSQVDVNAGFNSCRSQVIEAFAKFKGV